MTSTNTTTCPECGQPLPAGAPVMHRMSPATGQPVCSTWSGLNPHVTADARRVTCPGCQLIQGCWD